MRAGHYALRDSPGYEGGNSAGTETLVGVVRSDDAPPRSGGYGEKKLYKVSDYDHATFADKTVQPGTTCYYKVRKQWTSPGRRAISRKKSPFRPKMSRSELNDLARSWEG